MKLYITFFPLGGVNIEQPGRHRHPALAIRIRIRIRIIILITTTDVIQIAYILRKRMDFMRLAPFWPGHLEFNVTCNVKAGRNRPADLLVALYRELLAWHNRGVAQICSRYLYQGSIIFSICKADCLPFLAPTHEATGPVKLFCQLPPVPGTSHRAERGLAQDAMRLGASQGRFHRFDYDKHDM